MNVFAIFSVILLSHRAYGLVGNLTVTFYPEDEFETCGNGVQGVSLTTGDIPDVNTCFNLSDIFTSPNTTGFQLGRYANTITDPTGQLVLGVNYTLSNLDAFDPNGNYSRISITQVNNTRDEAGEGKAAGRRLMTYSLPDCEPLSRANGGDDPESWNPWFWMSCQTEPDGDCHVVWKGIQSFSIMTREVDGKSTCEDWTYLGAASRSLGQSVLAVGCLAAVVTLWVML